MKYDLIGHERLTKAVAKLWKENSMNVNIKRPKVFTKWEWS